MSNVSLLGVVGLGGFRPKTVRIRRLPDHKLLGIRSRKVCSCDRVFYFPE